MRTVSPLSALIYYEDAIPGEHTIVPSYTIDRQELLEYALKWDPLPQHIDDAAAGLGGITAPGIYLIAIKMALIHRMPAMPKVIATFGYEEVRFLRPARPGDVLTLDFEWLARRLSESRPGFGIVRHRSTLINQAGEPVMTQIDNLLMYLRPVES